MSDIIHLYHTNDFHSHFEKWPRIANFLNERKILHQETGEEMIILDIGDHMDRWHPYTEGTLGQGNVDMLNKAGYQYVTIGNNEGITLAHEALDTLYKKANFEILVANLYHPDGTRPDWVMPYTIHTTQKGTKIAFLGVTAFFQKFYAALGWEITEPLEEINKQIHQIKAQADLVVLLSHLGINDDEIIAAQHPEIDVILGGHTHHVLHQGRINNQTLICGGGKFGQYVGHVELIVDDKKVTIEKTARLYDTNNMDELLQEKEWVEALYKSGGKELAKVACTLTETLHSEWFKPSPLAQLLCEALREWSQADCAFLNAGLVLESLPKGTVTNGDIHRILPHPINPCVVEMPGRELKEILMYSRNEEWPHIQLKGLGFRGKIMGIMLYDQVEWIMNDKGVTTQININGKKLDLDKIYKLAIPDMFTFGQFFPQITRSQSKEYLMPEFLRDILIWKLTK